MAAQSLKTRKTRNVFLVVPDITNPFYANLFKTLQLIAAKRNYILTLFNTNEQLSEELRAVETAREMNAGGIVFASVCEQPAVLHALEESKIPVVLLNSYGRCQYDTVHGVKNLGTYLSTSHLIQQGHRRIAFAGATMDSIVGRSRKQGYLEAMGENGICVEEKLIFEMGFSEDAGYKAGKYFVSLRERPTAICCANDIIAMGVLAALHEEKIAVPEQMSLTGMDDIIYSRISNPPLTSVTNDSDFFAKKGFELLLERMEGGYMGAGREVIVGRERGLRDSVAPL